MTRLTALIIQTNSTVFCEAIEPYIRNGKFGFYIGCIDELPSGCERPRDLISSESIYDTKEEAKLAGDQLIEEIKKLNVC